MWLLLRLLHNHKGFGILIMYTSAKGWLIDKRVQIQNISSTEEQEFA
jgi:hypothetical protein